MALLFAPHPGTVLVCDYDLGRSLTVSPEMTKRRPVVVVSARSRSIIGPYLVVPLSTQAPQRPGRTHHRLPVGAYDFLANDADSWAKCALVTAVGSRRLDRFWRQGVYIVPRITAADRRAIRLGVIHALGAIDLLKAG